MSNRGLLESLALFAGTLLTIAQTRLDLVSVELQEALARSLSLLLATLVSLLCLGIGVVLITILLVVAFWDTHLLLALGVLGGVFLLSGTVLWILALRHARAQPRVFAASLSALSQDRQQLVSASE